MHCEDAIELISRDADGDLEPERGHELGEHLAVCSACRKAREELQTNRVLLRSLSPIPVPEGAWGRLLERIVGDPFEHPVEDAPVPAVNITSRKRPSWRPAFNKLLAAAASVAVLFLGSLFYLGAQESPEMARVPEMDPATVIQGHALSQSTDPWNDQALWHYTASQPQDVFGVYQPPSALAPTPPRRVISGPGQYAVPTAFGGHSR